MSILSSYHLSVSWCCSNAVAIHVPYVVFVLVEVISYSLKYTFLATFRDHYLKIVSFPRLILPFLTSYYCSGCGVLSSMLSFLPGVELVIFTLPTFVCFCLCFSLLLGFLIVLRKLYTFWASLCVSILVIDDSCFLFVCARFINQEMCTMQCQRFEAHDWGCCEHFNQTGTDMSFKCITLYMHLEFIVGIYNSGSWMESG